MVSITVVNSEKGNLTYEYKAEARIFQQMMVELQTMQYEKEEFKTEIRSAPPTESLTIQLTANSPLRVISVKRG